MTSAMTKPTPEAFEAAIMLGDLGRLTPEQRVAYYGKVCESVGLNPLTRPFDYITLNGKLTLYAKRDCTDQLRTLRGVSITIAARENIDGVYVVTARATLKDGRADESTGAVSIKGLTGESLANAYMKAETKAKRRVTLSACGLGLLDETEVSDVPGAAYPKNDAPVARTPNAGDSLPIKDVQAPALPEPSDERAKVVAAIKVHGKDALKAAVAKLEIKAANMKEIDLADLKRLLGELDAGAMGYDPISDDPRGEA